MRKTVPTLFVVTLVPALIVLPVLTPPRPAAHPVAPHIVSEALRGVDPAAWQALRATSAAAGGAQVSAGAAAKETSSASGTVVQAPAVLTPAMPTATYQLVGVTWDATAGTATTAGLRVSVRVRPTGHAWGVWEPLSVSDAAPDPGSLDARRGRTGTEPLVTGPSDGVQVRIDTTSHLAPTGARLELIDPGTSAADATIGALGPASSAAAAMSTPTIISRAQWGADESLRNGFAGYSDTIKVGFIHHSASSNSYSDVAGAAAQIRAIYAYDTNGLGWSDIAYNFLVDKFGNTYEGRAGGETLAVIGAHTAGFNRESFAVAALGCFDTTCSGGGLRPPAAMVTSISRVMAWKLGLFYRDPNGRGTLVSAGLGESNINYPAGTLVTTPTISGHRDVNATACPGNLLYPMLPSIRAQAASFLAAGLVYPSLSSASGSYGSAGPGVLSSVITNQTWSGSGSDLCRGGTIASLPTGSATRTTGIRSSWSGKTSTGAWALPGPYMVTLTSASSRGTALPWGSSYAVNAPPPAPPTPGAAVNGDGGYVPVTPHRLLDTRAGVYPSGPGGRIDLHVLGTAGIPASGVTSVYVTLTVTCPTTSGYVTVYAGGTTSPATSNQNFSAGQTRAVLVAAAVGTDGTISIFNAGGTTQVIADVIGYGAASGGDELTALPITRVLSTYSSPLGQIKTGESRTITLPALAGIPAASIKAVMVNLIAVSAPAAGWLSAYAGGTAWPGTSNLSYPAGATTDTTVIVPVSGGSIVIRNGGPSIDAAVDVLGVFASHSAAAGSRFTAVNTFRALDSRAVGGPLAAGASRAVTVAGGATAVPADAKAVLVSLTGVAPTLTTYLMAWAADGTTTVPPGALLRLNAGDVRANLVLVAVGINGQIMLRNFSGSTNAVVDVVGYFR